ncbi:methionyl-tRNA formyltransferase [Thioalkalivibrio paradoxus]|uniref:Formyl transferase N-terminal domain-containing protein n=1 Tax=Thioalkalivibrio paradoxus ARh 1 TaxID=713585 RepID=W0DTE4_9GAMM|nr:formyltransferase family protein [Thioalkalivibrio paradoxus]AHF00244.1 hypothetical protein THITH_13720 [Thioalkalivibrio paradoxus ARh 1]
MKRSLRVVLVGHVVDRLADSLAESQHEVVGLVQSGTRPSRRRASWPCRLTRGTWGILRPRPSGTALAAARHGVPWFDYASRSLDAAYERWLRQRAADVVLVFGMDWLLNASLLSVPALGTLNLHPALLPRYRGPRPTQWAFYHMDLRPGVTIHFVDAGEDRGDILHQRQFQIPAGTTWATYFRDFVEPACVELMLQALGDLADGTATRRPQPALSPTARARAFPPEEYARLIDWEGWPVARVWHFLRGAPPWIRPVAQLRGAPVWLDWQVGAYSEGGSTLPPGLVARTRAGWRIGCRDGEIHLEARWHPASLLLRLICSSR